MAHLELATETAKPEPSKLKQTQTIPRETEGVTIEARPVQEVTPDSAQLAKEQSEGNGTVATVYRVIQTGQDITRE